MRFIVITNDQQEEIWINYLEIAAIMPSRSDDYHTQVLLKNGTSFRCMSTAEQLYEGIGWHVDGNVAYNKV